MCGMCALDRAEAMICACVWIVLGKESQHEYTTQTFRR